MPNTMALKPGATVVAYRHKLRGDFFEWRVAPVTLIGTTYKLGRPLARGVRRDEAWKEARRLARGINGTAILFGMLGAAGKPKAKVSYTKPGPTPAPPPIVAKLTTFDLNKVSPEFRHKIALWLRAQAAFIEAKGKVGMLSPRYRARYYRV